MTCLTQIFAELCANGSAVLASSEVKSFNKAANAHGVKYEIGPHVAGKSVLVTI